MEEKNGIRIVPWEDQYAGDFIRLSEEWLVKYVSIEPADIEILHHPHENVLDPGGMIFFALDGKVPVGTVAMIPNGQGGLELAKLAVTESYKGYGISKKLMAAAMAFADWVDPEEVFLYTNRKLIPAIRLYEQFGFEEVPLLENKYLESDMKMILKSRSEAGKILVSECLAGVPCRMDGKSKLVPEIRDMVENGKAVVVCPEVLGGLPTPRDPSEIRDGRVYSSNGKDVTDAFVKGAEESMRICKQNGCKLAIMKAKSPSCGCGLIHNGLFDDGLVEGDGVFARMLIEAGVVVFNEKNFPKPRGLS